MIGARENQVGSVLPLFGLQRQGWGHLDRLGLSVLAVVADWPAMIGAPENQVGSVLPLLGLHRQGWGHLDRLGLLVLAVLAE
jgi:hypothetical protein